jgi:hypothetical protein
VLRIVPTTLAEVLNAEYEVVPMAPAVDRQRTTRCEIEHVIIDTSDEFNGFDPALTRLYFLSCINAT